MRLISIVVAIGLTACVTHVSKLELVRNISPTPQGLAVESCIINYVTHTDYSKWVTGGASKEHELNDGPCFGQLIPLAGVQ